LKFNLEREGLQASYGSFSPQCNDKGQPQDGLENILRLEKLE